MAGSVFGQHIPSVGSSEVTPRPSALTKKNRGCSSVWLECCAWDAEAAGSNPVTRTFSTFGRYSFLLLSGETVRAGINPTLTVT